MFENKSFVKFDKLDLNLQWMFEIICQQFIIYITNYRSW